VSIVISDETFRIGSNNENVYRDINLNWNGESNSRDITLEDFNSIRGAIRNLFTIQRGSRMNDDTFGSNLAEFLFEPITEDNAQLLGEEIEELLEQEPRIQVNDISIIMDRPNGQYEVAINFEIPSLSNERLNFQLGISQNLGFIFGSRAINEVPRANDSNFSL